VAASLGLVAGGLAGAVAPAIAAAPAAQEGATDFTTAAVTPEDALAYLVFEFDEESEQWAQAQRLIERAGFGDTLAQARDEIVQEAAGSDVPLEAILGGEGAIVVTGAAIEAAVEAGEAMAPAGLDGEATPQAGGVEPAATGAALLLDAGDPEAAFESLQTAIDEQAADSGESITEIDYEGTTIQFVPGGVGGDGDGMAVAQVDEIIVAAASPADIEPIIDTAEGGPSLADFAPFTDLRTELDEDFLLYGFFNGVAAAEAGAALGDQLGIAGGLAGRGTYSSFLVRADEPGFRMETVAAPAEGESFPAATETYESELADRVPGDALFFLSGANLGETGALDAVGAALLGLALGAAGGPSGVPAATPVTDDPDAAVAAIYEQAAGLIGVNLQTDLFQQFTGEFALTISSEADPSSITALFATDVADPGTVVNALNQLNLLIQGAAGGAAEATTRDVNGSQVNVIDTGDPAIPDVEYGVVEDQFLLAVGDAIDEFVEGPADSLADNAQFQDVFATLPEENNGLLYVDLAQIVPLLQGLAEADTGALGETGIEDAAPACADYESQEAAQEAYDAGEEGTFDLDQDFDGEVCEDFFAAATPEVATAAAATPVTEVDLSALRAFALVAYEENGLRRSSSILYIEPNE